MALQNLWAYLMLTSSKFLIKLWISETIQKILDLPPCLLFTKLTTLWASDSTIKAFARAFLAICKPHSRAFASTKETSPWNFEVLIVAAITFPRSSLIIAPKPARCFYEFVAASTLTLTNLLWGGSRSAELAPVDFPFEHALVFELFCKPPSLLQL